MPEKDQVYWRTISSSDSETCLIILVGPGGGSEISGGDSGVAGGDIGVSVVGSMTVSGGDSNVCPVHDAAIAGNKLTARRITRFFICLLSLFLTWAFIKS